MSNWHTYIEIKEPLLSFHPEQSFETTQKILGLSKWGPFDTSLPNTAKPINPIKIGLILPDIDEQYNHFKKVLEGLVNKIEHNKGKNLYLRTYKGFKEIYGVTLSSTKKDYFLSKNDIQNCLNFRHVLNFYLEKLRQIKENEACQLVLIDIPTQFEPFLKVGEKDFYFDLRDQLKLNAALMGIKTQFLREERILNLNNEDFLKKIWWLSGAIYIKAGGLTYRLSDINERILYVGLSYAIARHFSEDKILVGVAQLFDEYGNNIALELFSTADYVERGKNSFLTIQSARNVFEKLLHEYRRSKTKPPSKVIIHKSSPVNKDEIKGIRQALNFINSIEIVHLQRNHNFTSFKMLNDSTPNGFPINRGTALKISNYSFLLWTVGNAENFIKYNNRNLNYYQEARHIPSPLFVNRCFGNDTMEEVGYEILKLTKLNWNNLQYYNKMPVTVDFAKRIAEITKLAKKLPRLPKDFRFYI